MAASFPGRARARPQVASFAICIRDGLVAALAGGERGVYALFAADADDCEFEGWRRRRHASVRGKEAVVSQLRMDELNQETTVSSSW